MINFLSRRWVFWVYLTLLAVIGVVIVGLATATYGAGVSRDSIKFLSTADNLLKGHGFLDESNQPFVHWPPLYPLVLAGLSWVTGQSTFTAGQYLNMLSFGLIVWLGGALIHFYFKDEPFWGYLGGFVILTSNSLIRISANISSDPLFIVLAISFLLSASSFFTTKSRYQVLAMALLACFATLQRLIGITLIAAGIILIFYAYRENIHKAIKVTLTFGSISSLPFIAWVFGHNYLQYGTFFGDRIYERLLPLGNLQDSILKITAWFFPKFLVTQIPPVIFLVTPILILLLLNHRTKNWKRLAWRFFTPPILPTSIFSLIYFVTLLFTVDYIDSLPLLSDRYQAVLFVPALVFIIVFLEELVLKPSIGRKYTPVRYGLILIFATWLILPTYQLYKYIRISRLDGEISYNMYNTRSLQESKVVDFLRSLPIDEDQVLYSNYTGAAWFYARRPVSPLPQGPINKKINVDELLQLNVDWPGDRPGILIWFKPNDYHHILTPDDLKRIADLELLYKGKDGEIYRVLAGAR